MSLNSTQIDQLKSKLNPAHVMQPPRGKFGEYIEGWHAISEANRIFGFDGWSHSIDTLEMTTSVVLDDKFRIGYMCVVTVTAGGTVHTDVGTGDGINRSQSSAVESAIKEAVTDAIKRALRHWGNQFGLALYDKTKSNVGVDAPEPEENPFETMTEPEPEPEMDWPRIRDDFAMKIRDAHAMSDLAELWASDEFKHYRGHAPREHILSLDRMKNNKKDAFAMADQGAD